MILIDRRCGDYYLPNIGIPAKDMRLFGKYDRMRPRYLRKHRSHLFNQLLLSGKLMRDLYSIDDACQKRMDLLIPQMKAAESVTEEQKAVARMGGVRRMNSIHNRIEEIKQHNLSRRITTCTEEIEELRSEKENLLLDLGCANDADVKAVQSEITAIEASLHKLDEQKERCSVELDGILQQYEQLQSRQMQIQMKFSTMPSPRPVPDCSRRTESALMRRCSGIVRRRFPD